VTASDIMEFDLDSHPIDPPGRSLYTERFIHGEVYKARPDVTVILHTHAPPLIPFVVTPVPLCPIYHRAAFVSDGVPVFEIREAGGITVMLIRDGALGRALQTLGPRSATLMRGHGAVVFGPSGPMLVSRSIFLTLNATLQAQAMALGGPITYLDPEEARQINARGLRGEPGLGGVGKRTAMAKR
jgi:HCOMODA/2-hydroxy-3-carboxy-muconic semialdehyde decarboxylase